MLRKLDPSGRLLGCAAGMGYNMLFHQANKAHEVGELLELPP